MKKRIIVILAAVAAVVAYAAFSPYGKPRSLHWPFWKIQLYQNDKEGWEISEYGTLFGPHVATVHYDVNHLNHEEQKQLAVAVAQAIAGYYGSTNDIRVAHWEQPKPASTNLADGLRAWLQGKWITDEIVPTTTKKGGTK